MPGAQRSQSKHQAWESTVCRCLGTPGTTLGGPCVCTRSALLWVSEPAPRTERWLGGSQLSPIPPSPCHSQGVSSGEGLGGGRGHSSLDCHLSPKPFQLLAGRAAEVARRGTAAHGWPWLCSQGGGCSPQPPALPGGFVQPGEGASGWFPCGTREPHAGCYGCEGVRAPTGIISVGFPSSALKQSPAVPPLAVRILPNPVSPCVTSSPRRWPPPPDPLQVPAPLASLGLSVVAGRAARGTGQGASVAPQHPLCTPEGLAELGEI